MKKRIIASLLALSITLSLCSCAGTSESGTQSLVSNPFETSENENSETPTEDERYELYDKYQSGSLSLDFSEMNDAQNVEYNGEEINITFSANAANNQEDITIGYMAFIGGIPQLISVNGSEEAETVSVSFPKDEITNVSINIKPRVTKEIEDKKELNLQIISIFNIDYVPQGQYVGFGFGNINAGSTVYTACLTMNEKAETVELSGNAEFENIPASDSSLKSYTLKKAGEMDSGATLKMFSVNNETEHLILDNNTQTCDVIFDGTDFDTYNVLFYANHKRVQVNGKDYATVSAKAGYVPKLTATLENVNNHDIVYAIAVPLTDDYTKARLLKTTSQLSFSPDDEIIANSTTQSVADTSTDVPESEPENSSTVTSNSKLYKYNVVGYIDDDMNYLLLYQENSEHEADYDYAYSVYDKSTGEISEVFKSTNGFKGRIYPWDISCCDGQFTYIENILSEDRRDVIEIFAVTYNEKFEEISRLSNLTLDENIYYVSAVYSKQIDKYFVCYKQPGVDAYSIGRFSKDGKEEEKIFSESDYRCCHNILLADNRIILNKYGEDPNRYSIQVIDFEGNEITEDMPQSPDYDAWMGQKMGKYYCLLSKRTGYEPMFEQLPEDTLYLYDSEQDKIVEFKPEESIEMGCVRITPDGTKAVTIISNEVVNEEHTNLLYTDLVIKIYDLDTGEKINEIKSEKGKAICGRNMQAFDDRIVIYEDSYTDYILYQIRYDEQVG